MTRKATIGEMSIMPAEGISRRIGPRIGSVTPLRKPRTVVKPVGLIHEKMQAREDRDLHRGEEQDDQAADGGHRSTASLHARQDVLEDEDGDNGDHRGEIDEARRG